MQSVRRVAVSAAIWQFAPAAPVLAQSPPVTFAGKEIRLLIGFSPTAYGYDTYGRLLARYLGKYLPGHPLLVPENRPGAGALFPPYLLATR
jgi:tripartite-type tricarboxylate transporter receptor subunit TctC